MSELEVFDVDPTPPRHVVEAVLAQVGRPLAVPRPSRDAVDAFFRSAAQLVERAGGDIT